MESGIYKITNKINGKIYIGKTKNFKNRFRQYKYDFEKRRGDSINEYLLNSMVKYGFENFEFSILERCALEYCSERELFWITILKSIDKDVGYNLRLDSSTGMITHPSTSEKISKRLASEWANGTRVGHSDKMKLNWSKRDRSEQSRVMTKNLTKYQYEVYFGDVPVLVDYKGLVELGVKSVLSSFSRNKTDEAVCKGIRIRRVRLAEN